MAVKECFIVNEIKYVNDGYSTETPKRFSSESYGGDSQKALKRARGAYYTSLAAACNNDNTKYTALNIVRASTNNIVSSDYVGAVPEIIEEPEEEPVEGE